MQHDLRGGNESVGKQDKRSPSLFDQAKPKQFCGRQTYHKQSNGGSGDYSLYADYEKKKKDFMAIKVDLEKA